LHYPWGQQWQLAGTAVEERYARLGLRDAETSFDPTRYRMYGSNQGRWLSPDPVLGCVMHPENFNRYNYVADNPANLTDPQGLFLDQCSMCLDICDAAAGICFSLCLALPPPLDILCLTTCYMGWNNCFSRCFDDGLCG
jgi:RHS repeat-associated protein